MRRRVISGILAGAMALVGCSTFASHDEYGRYRRVRMADEERDRLIALQQYAEHHPSGRWIAEVQAARSEREDELWARSASTREGLEWYLTVYPDGRYVEQARPRLAALQHVENTAEQQRESERELRQQQRQQAAEARRTWVTRAVQYWTRTMVGLRGYGRSLRRIAQSNPEFAQAFGRPPAPVCAQDQYCLKHYGQLYHIPVPGATRLDRRVDVYLRLSMEDGDLERAEILLPGKGFSRWFEMENTQIVTDEDPQQRTEAINWALDRIIPIIQEVATGAREMDAVIPDPFEPLQQRAEGDDTDEAPLAPDEEPPPEAEPPAQAEGEGQTEGEAQEAEGEGGALDELLEQAAGPDPAETDPVEQPQTEPAEAETMIIPIGLMGWTYNGLQITVVAASPDDYGEAYDGVIIERIRN